MSWDAYLCAVVDGKDVEIADWNYTHNCNGMISTVLEEAGYKNLESHWLIGHMGKSWFRVLDGMGGADSGRLLDMIVSGLEAEPERFEKMNPENGWGKYATLLPVLREMRGAAKEYPSAVWRVSG